MTTGRCRFTHGDHNDRSPVWSPDGSQLAFISTRDKKTGIYIMPSAGGAEKKIIEIEGAHNASAMDPRRRNSSFSPCATATHILSRTRKQKKGTAGLPSYHQAVLSVWTRWAFSRKTGSRSTRWISQSAKLRKITKGKRDNVCPNLSPDGKLVTYRFEPSPQRGSRQRKSRPFRYSVQGRKREKNTDPGGSGLRTEIFTQR